MTAKSKAWDWEMVNGNNEEKWKSPSQEIYYLINRWKKQDIENVLDLGCGIGRHSILLAQEGFTTYGLDLSENAINRAQTWSNNSRLNIDFRVADMLNLPYNDEFLDAIFAYYLISHTDTKGVIQILKEIRRVLKSQGEVYLTLGSKDSWGFKENWPVVDENTKIRIEDGPDNNVPHFYADPQLIFELFSDFDILDVRQIERIEQINNKIKKHHHYHVLAKKR